MYRRKDSDIFGTAGLGYAPRIHNPASLDPNAAFRERTELNYERYQSTLTPTPQSITARPLDASKVNEEARFEEHYHRARKEQDLQSSIFYPPTARPPRPQLSENDPLLANRRETAHGRREVFKREINGLPLNTAQLRGNSSRLFDLDERTKFSSEDCPPLRPLIPHQMNWDQHDSVKYAHINDPHREPLKETVVNCVEESKSTVFEVAQEQKPEQTSKSVEKAEKKGVEGKSKKEVKPSSVEIKIAKGWEHRFMEGLSKHCKLNNSAVLGFDIDSEGKVFLTIKRSERWENVTDWLRKDCKLKLRI